MGNTSKQRKIQYYKGTDRVKSYYSSGEMNPCGCGSNCFHYEYDGSKIYGVCNACDIDIYVLKNEYVEEKLAQEIWK